MKNLLLLTACLLLVSCAGDRDKIRSGMLSLNVHKDAFLKEWGKPTRTRTTTGDEVMSASWGGGGGGFFKGKETVELWTYEDKKTDLYFRRNGRLAAWNTGSTVNELAKPEK